MKSIIALGVGLVVALAPGGTAFAGTADNATGNGKAYGNCAHSSANGVNDPRLEGGAGKGNGGHVKVAKANEGCVVPTAPVKVPVDPPAPVVGDEVDQSEAAAS